MSVLTGRYTGSPETTFGVDIRNISEQDAEAYLDTVERAELSDAFWNVGLPQQMDTSVSSSPYFNVFLASQVKGNDKGFLASDHTVQNLLEGFSHIHHVFPRNYLKKTGLARSRYNQIANYVVMQGEINIAIGDQPPSTYFRELRRQCENGTSRYGGITKADQLRANMEAHCIPQGMDEVGIDDYNGFLQRRQIPYGREDPGLLQEAVKGVQERWATMPVTNNPSTAPAPCRDHDQVGRGSARSTQRD